MKSKNKSIPIPFHFLDSKLCEQFLDDLSVDLLVKLLRDSTAGPRVLFPGFRITSKTFRTPPVQKKLRSQLIQFKGLRVLLCRSWLFAKEPFLEPHIRNVLTSLGRQDGSFISQLEELQHNTDSLDLATTLVNSFVWTEVPIDDIRILISVVNCDYFDQETLSDHVERLIQSSKDDPSRFVERAKRSVEAATRRVAQYKKEKDALLTEMTEYEEKLTEGEELQQKELLLIQREVAAVLSREDEESKIRTELENQLRELEAAERRTVEQKSELTHRQQRIINKFNYEKSQLRNAIDVISKQNSDLESTIKTAIRHQEKVKDNLDRIQQAVNALVTKKTDQGTEQAPIGKVPKTQLPPSQEKLGEWLSRLRRLIVTPIPSRANDVGFVATPVSLMAVSQMSLETSEAKLESLLQNGHWIDEELVLFAQRKSKELYYEDRQLAAEIALSGIFHSLRAENTDLVDIQILSFLDVLSAQSPQHANSPWQKSGKCQTADIK